MDHLTEFNEAQYNSAYPDGVNNHYWSDARNVIIYDLLKQYSLHSGNVIEIGCGRGGVVSYLHNRGVKILGVELAPCTPFEEAKELVYTGTDALTLKPAIREKFETLLLLDVIEHIEKPDEFIKNIVAAFPNLKQLLITVPSRMEIWSNYDEYYGHFIRYDNASLEQVVRQSGGSLLYKSYIFRVLYCAAWVLSKFSIKRSVIIKAPHGPSIFIHKMLSRYFQLEYKVLPKSWKGSSLICLVKVR